MAPKTQLHAFQSQACLWILQFLFVFFCLSLGHPVLHWQLLFIGQSTIMCRYFQVFLRTCGRQQSLLFCMACPSFTTRVGRALLCHGAFWPKQLYIATCFMEPTEALQFFSCLGPGLSLSQCRLASMVHFQISLSITPARIQYRAKTFQCFADTRLPRRVSCLNRSRCHEVQS